MKVIVCEMCEGTEFLKQDGMFICQGCGTKYSIEEAKKLMKEVEGAAPSAADTSSVNKDLERYLLLARRAKDSSNSADAAKYYSMVQTEDPNSWEAAFYSAYFTAMQTNIANITSAASLVTNCLPSVVGLIQAHTPEEEQHSAITELTGKVLEIGIMLKTAAVNHYNNTDISIRAKYTDERNGRVQAVMSMFYVLGDALEAAFSQKSFAHASISTAWQSGLNIDQNFFNGQRASVITTYYTKLHKYDPKAAKSFFQTRITALENQNVNLAKTTKSNGCLGAFMLFLAALAFVMYSILLDADDYEFLLGIAGVLAVIGVICYIPKKLSPEMLAKRQATIDENNKTIAQLRKLLGE